MARDSMDAIGVGLAGFGLAGGVLHAPVIAAVDGLKIVAAVTSRTGDVAARYPGARVHATLDAMLADPAVELVVITTPNARHAADARAALSAGKHVVVDKPFVTDAAEGEALIALAKDRGRALSIFHNRRWDADFLTARKLVEGRALGDILLAELHWDRFRPAIKPGWRETAAGGGLLADLGPHLIDQALLLFGRPDAVGADVAMQRPDALTDDYFAITLYYGQARVTLASSSVVASARPRFALHGTRGSFVKHGLDPQEAVLRTGGVPGDPGYGVEPDSSFGQLTLGEAAPRPVPGERGDWRHFYTGMRDAIRDGPPVPVDPADAVAGLRIIEAARVSAREGRVVGLG